MERSQMGTRTKEQVPTISSSETEGLESEFWKIIAQFQSLQDALPGDRKQLLVVFCGPIGI